MRTVLSAENFETVELMNKYLSSNIGLRIQQQKQRKQKNGSKTCYTVKHAYHFCKDPNKKV